jgi:hypothetical protein
MERQFIIFAEEHSGDHFCYCTGENHSVKINNITAIQPYIDIEALDEALTSKKRFFTVNKTRYRVVQRGTLYEP